MAAVFKPETQLRRRGGFACAVYADDQDHKRFAIGAWCGWQAVGGQAFGEVTAGRFHHFVGGNLAPEIAQLVEDRRTQADAKICADEVGLEIVPIDFRAVGDLVEKRFEKACHG